MNVFKAVFNLFRNNIVLKITAVVFAVILWSYVFAETNPPRTKVLENVHVSFQNMQMLKDKGLTISENLSTLMPGVRIELEVRQKESALVTTDNVTATVDLSTINGVGETEVKISPYTKYGAVLSIQPSHVKVTVDDYMRKSVPVECRTTGIADTAFYFGEPQLSPDVIEIAGARKDVEQVTSAMCEVDLTSLKESLNQSFNLTLLNRDRLPFDNSVFFEKLPSVILSMDVLPKKSVPINGASSVVHANRLKNGYEIKSVRTDPAQIEIAGKSDVIGAIEEVFLEPVDVTGASSSLSFHVRPSEIEGVRYIGSEEVKVDVSIGQIQDEKTVKGVTVKIRNLPAGMKASVEPRTVNVHLSGGVIDLDDLNRNNLSLYVDLKGYAKGVHNVTLYLEPADTAEPCEMTPAVSKVRVTLK